jgi:hypothetical protein
MSEYSSEEEIILDEQTDSESDMLDDGSSFSYDTELEYDIYLDRELYYNDEDELDDGYYIGVCNNELVLANYVTVNTFYKYPIDRIKNYLVNWSIDANILNGNIEILRMKKKLQLHIVNNFNQLITMYNCVLKTHYLKIVQQSWRRVLEYRKRLIKCRMNIKSIHYRQIHGKWPYELSFWPTFKGCIHYPNVFDLDMLYKYV